MMELLHQKINIWGFFFFFQRKSLPQTQIWIKKITKNSKGTIGCRDNYRLHVSKVHGKWKFWVFHGQMSVHKLRRAFCIDMHFTSVKKGIINMEKGICLGHTVRGMKTGTKLWFCSINSASMLHIIHLSKHLERNPGRLWEGGSRE